MKRKSTSEIVFVSNYDYKHTEKTKLSETREDDFAIDILCPYRRKERKYFTHLSTIEVTRRVVGEALHPAVLPDRQA